MILIDYSSLAVPTIIAIGSAYMQEENSEKLKNEFDSFMNIFRVAMLNQYENISKKFVKKYGKIYVCRDSTGNWRKEYFTNYKANRKQKQSGKFWTELAYPIMNKFLEETNKHLYPTLELSNCEADDVIGSIVIKFKTLKCPIWNKQKILIVSEDKDFIQLTYYKDVDLYSNHKNKMIEVEDPTEFILEQIIHGDSSDGVPNILSSDDVMLRGDDGKQKRRQTPVTKNKNKLLREQIINNKFDTPDIEANYNRNKKMIDFHCIPKNYMDNSVLIFTIASLFQKSLNQFEYITINNRRNIPDFYGGHDYNVYRNL
jgi:hypothetical protein